jgi:hypothetical protein
MNETILLPWQETLSIIGLCKVNEAVANDRAHCGETPRVVTALGSDTTIEPCSPKYIYFADLAEAIITSDAFSDNM